MIDLVEESQPQKSYGYGKRPLWQWIVLYVVIAAVIYGLIYYFVFAKNGGYGKPSMGVVAPSPVVSAPSSNIYMTKTDSKKGTYLTDFAGMTLYVSSKDTAGVSNCTGTCATNWPPYMSGGTAEKTLPANITVITRADGSKQFAWKGFPLYYFAGDAKTGDITGDGVGPFTLAK